MDPVSIGIQAVGMGMKLFGAFSGASDSSEYASQNNSYEQQKFGLEKQVNQQRQQAMELSARRQQLEVFRNTQRARAQGLNAATNQGAQFGSGLQGGQAESASQGLFNAQGINQNLQIGQNIFGLDNQITGINSQQSTLKARYQSQQAQDQAWQSLGGSLMQSGGTIGNISGAASSGFSQVAGLFSGGSLSGGFGNT
jgi:hypothetical protein